MRHTDWDNMTGADFRSIQCSLLEVDWVCLYYLMFWVGW